jgi:hypothetical protein
MGWLSRTFRPAGETAATTEPGSPEEHPVPSVPISPDAASSVTIATDPGAVTVGEPTPSGPVGRYGPLVSVTRFEAAPPELEWQLPLNGELYRLMPGSDRPDYSLLVLDRPLHFYPQEGFDLNRVDADQRVDDRKGRTMVRVHALLLCARYVGQQLHPGMTDLAVNLAYVIDNSLARDAEVDFAKIEFAAIGSLSEGHQPRQAPTAQPAAAAPRAPTAPAADAAPAADSAPAAPAAPAAPQAPAVAPTDGEAEGPTGTRPTVSDLLDEVAATLRQGVAAQRGAPVDRLTAALTLDAEHRLTGLSGNADGQAPVPTPETFARLGELLARLAGHGEAGRVAAVTVRVDGDAVSHEVTGTH